MKKSIDIASAVTSMFILNTAFKNKFKRYWGTTNVDGVEVFNKFFQFYPNTDDETVQKLLKMLGVQQNINDSTTELDNNDVKSAFFWINPQRLSETIKDDLNHNIVSTRFEERFLKDERYECTVYLSVDNHIDAFYPVFNKGEARDYILQNYETLVLDGVESSVEVEGKDVRDTMAKFLLFSGGDTYFEFEHKDVQLNVKPYMTSENGLRVSRNRTFVSVLFSATRTVNQIPVDSSFVSAVYEKLHVKDFSRDLVAVVAGFTTATKVEEQNYTDALFYDGCLRESAIRELKGSKFTANIVLALDIHYKYKEASGFMKVLGGLLFVAVLVFSYFCPPCGAAALGGLAAGATAGAIAASIAVSATVAAIGLSLVSAGFSASSQADAVGFYGRFIKIFSVVSLVTGIAGSVMNFYKEVAKKALSSAVEGAVLSELSTAELLKAAKEVTLESIKDEMTLSTSSVIKSVDQAVSMVANNRIEKISLANNALQQSIKEQNNALYEEYSKEFNLPLEALTWQYEPLKQDQSEFEVDYLYEPTQANICRRSFL